MFCRSNYGHKASWTQLRNKKTIVFCRVPPARFERATFALGMRCSIQLSYEGDAASLSIAASWESVFPVESAVTMDTSIPWRGHSIQVIWL